MDTKDLVCRTQRVKGGLLNASRKGLVEIQIVNPKDPTRPDYIRVDNYDNGKPREEPLIRIRIDGEVWTGTIKELKTLLAKK